MSTDHTEPTPQPTGPGEDQYVPDESWQPGEDDALLDHPSEDVLDEGVTAPDDDPLAGLDLTEQGQREGEDHDDRLAREEPDVWEDEPSSDDDSDTSPYAGPGPSGEPAPDGVDDTAVGRLVSEPDDDEWTDEPGESQDVLAQDVGVDAARFMPEESAMHTEEEVAVEEGGTVEPDERA
ncbi:hypothetical protein GCM10023169_06590 [Georgenia halophila]|uniref:DUF5709 domain-containing protein n=1 Tax=Georgenia halophila TaxID=620889 RepID=A0ABP8KVX1_9MICO